MTHLLDWNRWVGVLRRPASSQVKPSSIGASTLILVLVCLMLSTVLMGLVAWCERAQRQGRAVEKLEALDSCTIFYDFELYPCRLGRPSWLAAYLDLHYVHSAVVVNLAVDDVDAAEPLLQQLPALKEIRLFDPEYVEERPGRVGEAIQNVRAKFPHLKVDEAEGCPLMISVTPVVG